MGKVNKKAQIPRITLEEGLLTEAGFTKTGINQLQKTLQDLVSQLFEKSVAFGNIDKKDSDVEITHEHVRNATRKIFGIYGENHLSWKNIICQLAEHVFTIIVGVASSNLDKEWGVSVLVGSSALFLILFFTRLFFTRNN